MSDYIFLFDMDSTITRKEVLPEVSKRIGKLDEMRRLTEATMRGRNSISDKLFKPCKNTE